MVWINNQLIYDTHWQAWEEMKRWGPMSRHARRLVRKVYRRLRFSSVLDVGCGPGRHLRRLREAGFPVAGLDRSAALLQWSPDGSALAYLSAGIDLPSEASDETWLEARALDLPYTRPGRAWYCAAGDC